MARSGKGDNSIAVRYILRAVIVFVASLAAAGGLYELYDSVFPYAKASIGICRHCGHPAQITTRGWSSFCAVHTPYLAILQVVMIIAEVLLMLAVVVSFWMILRGIARWGGWRESVVIAILCAGIAVMFVAVTQNKLSPLQQFFGILFYYIFVLSAVFVDRLESVVILALAAVAASAAVAFIIQIAFWIFVGYMWK